MRVTRNRILAATIAVVLVCVALFAQSYTYNIITITGQLISTVATGAAPFVVASTTPVANLSIGGNAATATTATTAGSATSVAFSGVTPGTNAGALVIGTGGSFTTSGTGTLGSTTPVTFSGAGAASISSLLLSGTYFSGGTGTTTRPFLYINQSANAPSTWSTFGTLFGINLNSAFGGTANIFDFHYDGGASFFKMGGNGAITMTSSISTGTLASTGFISGATFNSATNCADSAGAAACGSAAAGAFVVDAGATTTVVSTTAVTANSEIFVMFDSSLGTRLSITCNTTVALPSVSARTAGASFTITVPATPITQAACFDYFIVN